MKRVENTVSISSRLAAVADKRHAEFFPRLESRADLASDVTSWIARDSIARDAIKARVRPRSNKEKGSRLVKAGQSREVAATN